MYYIILQCWRTSAGLTSINRTCYQWAVHTQAQGSVFMKQTIKWKSSHTNYLAPRQCFRIHKTSTLPLWWQHILQDTSLPTHRLQSQEQHHLDQHKTWSAGRVTLWGGRIEAGLGSNKNACFGGSAVKSTCCSSGGPLVPRAHIEDTQHVWLWLSRALYSRAHIHKQHMFQKMLNFHSLLCGSTDFHICSQPTG